MKLVITLPALDDLDELTTYIHQRNPHAAATALHRIDDAIRRLTAYPEMGRTGRVSNTRELVVPGTKYVVAYRIREGVIEVLRVLHGARRRPRRL